MEIQILPPQEKDMMGVQLVFYKTWLETYPNKEVGITKEDIEDRFVGRFSEEILRTRWERIQAASNRKMLLAKDGDVVAGLIVVTLYPDKNQLQSIYILSQYQRQGVGQKLWKEAQRYINIQNPTIVEVATYNTQAINFYLKLGFKDTGKRFTEEKFRFRSGAIMPLMELLLPTN